jgi:23S rRNA (uracil1939-C5)-methyltransferase
VILELESLAAGGDAVAHDRGKVVFVTGGAPGDRAEVELDEDHAGWSRGHVVALIAPGPARVTPHCPLAAARTCGGCAWQHVARDAQLAAKQAIVAGALRKLDGLAIDPIVRASPDRGWRRRARFHWVRPRGAGALIGLYAPRSRRITDVEACPQLEPELDRALGAVRDAARALGPRGELHLARGGDGAVHVVIDGPCDADAARALVGKAGIVGVRAADQTFGAAAVELDAGVLGAGDDFAQASADGNRALGEIAASLLGAGDGRPLLELFAGGGNLTRHAVALGWRVTATDAVAPARAQPGVETITAPIDAALTRIRGLAFDAVLLDPPRAGAREAIAAIVATGAREVVYVSCDPATLARDAQALVAAGFAARRAVPLDLMPDTPHVEVVLRLERA